MNFARGVSASLKSWTSKHADDFGTAYQFVRSYMLCLHFQIRTFCPSFHKFIKDDTRCPFHLQRNEPKSGTVNRGILTAKRLLEFIPSIKIYIVGRFLPFLLEANHWNVHITCCALSNQFKIESCKNDRMKATSGQKQRTCKNRYVYMFLHLSKYGHMRKMLHLSHMVGKHI